MNFYGSYMACVISFEVECILKSSRNTGCIIIGGCPIFYNPTDSTSYSGSTTFELSSLGDGVRTSDLEDLKANAIKCLTDGFFRKLLDLEEV